MGSRKIKIFWKELSSTAGIFLGMYLAVLPFLIVISVNSGIAVALVLPTIALALVMLAMIPVALNEADRQIYYENKETIDILKGN